MLIEICDKKYIALTTKDGRKSAIILTMWLSDITKPKTPEKTAS